MERAPSPYGENLLRQVVETVPGGVIRVASDGSVLLANAEAQRLLGQGLEQLTTRRVADFAPETFREDGTPCPVDDYPVALALATGRPAGPTTIGVKLAGGAVHWAVYRAVPVFGDDGAPDGAVVTFLDVTEHKRAHDALRAIETTWRMLAENLPDFVVVVGRDARIRSINRVLPQYDAAAIVGTDAETYVAPDDRDGWLRSFRAALDEHRTVRFETRGVGPDGRAAWYESLFVPLVDGVTEDRVMVVARDVTAQRMILARLAEKERLAGVGLVASSVAHEVMNPLTYVLANLELARRGRDASPERVERALADAYEGATRMRQIVSDLRSIGRSGSEDSLFVDVRAVVETAARLTGFATEQASVVAFELDGLPNVYANESRLCQVFMNLLVNAAQAMEHLPTDERRVLVRARPDDGRGFLAVEVRDRGRGIPAERLERVFEPFYSTKRDGTGLGLSISRDMVLRMGGRLEVESEPERGTTFTVWLPTRG